VTIFACLNGSCIVGSVVIKSVRGNPLDINPLRTSLYICDEQDHELLNIKRPTPAIRGKKIPNFSGDHGFSQDFSGFQPGNEDIGSRRTWARKCGVSLSDVKEKGNII